MKMNWSGGAAQIKGVPCAPWLTLDHVQIEQRPLTLTAA